MAWRDAFDIVDEGIDAEAVHVWPFDPALPLDVLPVSVGSERRIRLNRHDYLEVFVVLSGELAGQVQDRPLGMRAGDVFVMGSTHYHTLGAARGTARVVALFFLRELICRDWTDEKAELLKPFLYEQAGGPCVIRGQRRLADDLLRLLAALGRTLPAESARARVLARATLEMLLARLVEHFGPALDRVSPPSGLSQIQRLRPLFDRVDRAIDERISIGQAARLVAMSRTSFVRCFKRVMGQTFTTYIGRLRVARAQHLLATTDWTIADVAQRVGYAEQSYFCRVFRRIAGTTPRAYRRRVQPARGARPVLHSKA